MPKPPGLIYEKKSPYRDAFYFIIVCEGENTEIEYFKFFDGMSSRVKIVPISGKSHSAPKYLIEAAYAKEQELELNSDHDRLWFVIDTDKWGSQLHDIRIECSQNKHWSVAQSNPCFEVWLYFHVKSGIPKLERLADCNQWKPFVHSIIRGGFSADRHPVLIETAINNARKSYREEGYFPNPGSTQVWKLGEELLLLIKKELEPLKQRFPKPVVIDL